MGRLVILLLMVVLTAGCMSDEDEVLPEEESNENERIVQVKDSSPNTGEKISNKAIATHLANIAGSVKNVSDASAVVAGPYAVVGIDVDKNLDRSRVGTIKYSVSESLQNDPYGKTAVVIADGDIVERLRRMGLKTGQGYPTQGIIDELSAIIGRYMPQGPVQQNKPKEPDQNKEIMPEKEKDKLKEKEQEQSNETKQDD